MAIHHRKTNLDSPLLGEGVIFRSNSMGGGSYKKLRGSGGRTGLFLAVVALVALACVGTLLYPDLAGGVRRRGGPPQEASARGAALPSPPVLVSYSYFEKDAIQVRREGPRGARNWSGGGWLGRPRQPPVPLGPPRQWGQAVSGGRSQPPASAGCRAPPPTPLAAPAVPARVFVTSRPTRPAPPSAPRAPQKENFEFFITVGMGLGNRVEVPTNTDFVVVVNGKVCRPCSRLYPLLK